MPEKPIYLNDFSTGWCPSDDAINGRKNGLLQMDNLELDKNGALSLTGGTNVIRTLTYPVMNLYSRFQGGVRNDYSNLFGGTIYRDGTLIGSGGDTYNAAYGTAFNFTLICCGTKRLKDTGSGTPVNLGVGAPTASLDVGLTTTQFDCTAIIGDLINNYVVPIGSASIITSSTYPDGGGHVRPAPIKYLQGTCDANGNFVTQTSGVGAVDLTQMTSGLSSSVGTSTDDDVIAFYGYVTNPAGCSLEIDILLEAGNAYGNQPYNYYSYKINDLSTVNFDLYTGAFYFYMKRSDFIKVGTSGNNWSTTYGYRITFHGTAGQVVNLLGPSLNPTVGLTSIVMAGGSKAYNGVYQFAQVNVNNTGSYLAKSPMGPISNAKEINLGSVGFYPQVPADSQVTEIWYFARSTGGTTALGNSSNLGNWYRIGVQTGSFSLPYKPTMADLDALTLNITYNQNLVSIASTGISDKIFDIVGPIQGRWLYFTTNMMYPSDISNPDLVDASQAVRTCGSNNELFLWARAISSSVVLVGTTNEIYLLTGTFATLPDGTVDLYYQPLGVKFPPISIDASAYGGAVYYLANDGWRMCMATSFGTTYSSQNNQLLVAPNTDRIYRGETCYGYTPFSAGSPSNQGNKCPVVVARNKLWCAVSDRIDVYDFNRNYWRCIKYGLGSITSMTVTQDGKVLAAFLNDSKLREIGYLSSKLIDGTTKQTTNLLTTFNDGGTPRQRKDVYTLRMRFAASVGDQLTVTLTNSNNNSSVIGTTGSTTSAMEQFIDCSQNQPIQLTKSIQIAMTGQFADFTLDDISIDYDVRPLPLSYLLVQPSDWGNPTQKRARTWPVSIDTLGQNIIFTPTVDGVPYAHPTTLNCSGRRTLYHFFTDDVFGRDYGCTFYDPTGQMEIYSTGQPDFVQSLPMPRRFDQIGPAEFARFGKIVQIGFRVYAFGTAIPWTIYFADNQVLTGTFTVAGLTEDTYYIDIPKGINGRIMRVTLGPTNFNFHRYYMKFKVAQSGGQEDSDLQWITIPNMPMGM